MRIVCVVAAATLAVIPMLLPAAVASAQPNDQDAVEIDAPVVEVAAADSTRFGFAELGLGRSTTLDLAAARTRVTVPSPAGSIPSSLNAILTTPAWLDRGWVDIEAGGRPITRIELDRESTSTPISVPLSAAPTADGVIALDLIPVLIPSDRYCPNPSSDAVRLIDASVDYVGQPTLPRTIAEFLPVLLRQLTVFVPVEPDRETATAATMVATSIVHHYGAQPVRVVVRPDSELQGATPDGPFERSIVLRENSDAGAELVYPLDQAPPRMYLTGTGADLTDQARLLTSNLSAIAVATAATAGPAAPKAVLPSESTTLDDLGIGTVTGSGGSTATASMTLDQTQLGRSAADLSVHLTGSYTPGTGALRATVDGSPLAVWEADESGRLDRWIDIPNTDLGRIVTVDVSVDHPSDPGSDCRSGAHSTVTVDGSTQVRSSGSSTPTPLGWESIPQALMPRFGIALADESFTGVVRAITMAAGLQRLSGRPLMPEVVSMDRALDGSAPAVVIAPAADLPEEVTLPMSASGDTTLRVADPGSDGDPAELTIDTARPFATVQVTSVHDKAVVVASWNSTPAELDAVLSWLGADSARWFSLSGDILFAASGTDPIPLSSSELSGAADRGADSGGERSDRTRTLVVGLGSAVLAVACVVALAFAIRARRSRSRSSRHNGSQ